MGGIIAGQVSAISQCPLCLRHLASNLTLRAKGIYKEAGSAPRLVRSNLSTARSDDRDGLSRYPPESGVSFQVSAAEWRYVRDEPFTYLSNLKVRARLGKEQQILTSTAKSESIAVGGCLVHQWLAHSAVCFLYHTGRSHSSGIR